MKGFDLQGVELPVPAATALAYIADPANLPAWTNAFAEAGGKRATMRTPDGELDVGLEVVSSATCGSVDWRITFPDGSIANAYSRVVALDEQRCAYTFVLTPPPGPLQEIEGALEQQAVLLTEELARLREMLDGR